MVINRWKIWRVRHFRVLEHSLFNFWCVGYATHGRSLSWTFSIHQWRELVLKFSMYFVCFLKDLFLSWWFDRTYKRLHITMQSSWSFFRHFVKCSVSRFNHGVNRFQLSYRTHLSHVIIRSRNDSFWLCSEGVETITLDVNLFLFNSWGIR